MAVTAESILDTYAADIAEVVKQEPATDLGPFAMQLLAASEELLFNQVEGYGRLDIAAAHLFDVVNAGPEPRQIALRAADHYLAESADMVRDFLATR